MQTLTDIQREAARLAKAEAGTINVERELLDTVLPLIHALATETRVEFGNVAEALEELLEDYDDDDEFDDDEDAGEAPAASDEAVLDEKFALAAADTLRLGATLLAEVWPDEEVLPASDFGSRLLLYYEASNKLVAHIQARYLIDVDDVDPDYDTEDATFPAEEEESDAPAHEEDNTSPDA